MTSIPFTSNKNISCALTASQVGTPFENSKRSDKTVQIFGTFGGTVTMQGSNDPAVLTDELNGTTNAIWFTLTDNSGVAITASANAAKLIAENPRSVRPSAGSGVSAVSVIIEANEG